MKTFACLALARHSCRSFVPGSTVEKEKLDEILKAALLAPSAGNSQPWRYIAVDEPSRVAQLALCIDGSENEFCADASAFVVVLEEKKGFKTKLGESIKSQRFMSVDIGGSVAHLLLAAADLGVASCVLGSFNERKIKTLLRIPKTRRIRLVIALGTEAKTEPLTKNRRPFDESVTYNKF